jgi:large subunit ribosomal protein L10
VPTQAKAETIQELKQRLQGARTAVLTEYRGLTVQQLSELRKQLRGVAAEYRVVKNRLARLALADSSLSALGPHLTGPIGVVIGRRDPVAVAKALSTFTRTTPGLQVRVGVIDGQVVDRDALRAVADLPSQETLRGQLVGAIQGPLAQLVGLLVAPHRELAYVLAERARTAPAEAGPSEATPVAASGAISTDAGTVEAGGATEAVGRAGAGPAESAAGVPVDAGHDDGRSQVVGPV